jgi:hypothetical protein
MTQAVSCRLFTPESQFRSQKIPCVLYLVINCRELPNLSNKTINVSNDIISKANCVSKVNVVDMKDTHSNLIKQRARRTHTKEF